MSQMLLDIAPEWVPTLDNFVAGRNVELLAALRQAAAGAAEVRAVYLWGEAGSGKSHLLRAMAAQHGIYAVRAVPMAASLVAVDDVEALDDAAQIALFELYNRMREQGGLLLVSGRQAPAHLALRDDLRTRLSGGHVFALQALSEPERRAVLRQAADVRGIALSDEVMDFMLTRFSRDLGSLMELLALMDGYALQTRRAITIPLIKAMMDNT